MKTEISIKWSIDDVLWQAKNQDTDLTKEQASDVLEAIEKNHDAEIGINWEVISFWINKISGV